MSHRSAKIGPAVGLRLMRKAVSLTGSKRLKSLKSDICTAVRSPSVVMPKVSGMGTGFTD